MLSKILASGSGRPIEWAPVSPGSVQSGYAGGPPGGPDAQGAPNFERRLQMERETGFQAGKQAGFELARADLEILRGQLARTISDVASMKTRLRAEAEQDIVRLALAIARKILHREVCTDRDAIAGVLKAALSRLAQRDARRVLVHPDDADSLRRHLAASGLAPAIEIVADPSLIPGSLIFETARGCVDASIDSQLNEIERGFTDLLERG